MSIIWLMFSEPEQKSGSVCRVAINARQARHRVLEVVDQLIGNLGRWPSIGLAFISTVE